MFVHYHHLPPPLTPSYIENLMLNVMVLQEAFGRGLVHEGRAFINGISALIKEAPKRSLAPSAMWSRDEVSSLQSRKVPSPQLNQAGILISNFQPPEL